MAKIEYELIFSDNDTLHSLYKFKAIGTTDDIADIKGFIDILAQHATVSTISIQTIDDNYSHVFSCSAEKLTIKQLRDAAIVIKAAGFSLGKNMTLVADLKVANYIPKKKPQSSI